MNVLLESETIERRVPSEGMGTLLGVGPDEEDLFFLRNICAGAGWTLREARTLKGALACLDGWPIPVVLCERTLPDGRWKELLGALGKLPHPPLLIVWSRQADSSLWAEVLNLGGFDVLAAPFRVAEVVHVVGMALRTWRGGRETGINSLNPALAV